MLQEKSLLLYENVLNSISDGFVALDKEWKYVYVNKKGAALLNNHTPEQLIGHHIWTLFPEGVGQPFQLQYERVMKERVPITLLDYYAPWDKYFENRIYPAPDGGITILYTEVTEKIKAENQMKESEMSMKMILDNTEESFIVMNKDLTIITYNKSAEVGAKILLGESFRKGVSILSFAQPDRIPALKAMYSRILNGEKVSYKMEFPKAGEEVMVLQMNYSPIRSEDGTVTAIMLNTRNISTEERATRQIIKNQQLLLETEDIALVGSWEWEVGNKELTWSEGAYKICGWEPNSQLPRAVYVIDKVLHPEDRERVQALYRRLLASNEGFQDQFRIVRPNGEERVVLMKGQAILDTAGKLDKIIGTVQDVTDLKAMERYLQKSQQCYQSLFDQNPDGVFSADLEGNFTSINQGLADLMKTSKAELLRADLTSFSILGFAKRILLNFKRAASGRPTRYEVPIRIGDGQKIIVDVTHMPVIVDGEIIGVYGVVKDITAKVDAQQELEKAHNELSEILDASVDVICTIDENGCFVMLSAACQAIWGYTPEEMVGKRYIDFVLKEDREGTNQAATSIKAGVAMTNFENRYVRKDGTHVPIVWSARWQEEYKTMYCIARDASERKNAEYALKRSEENLETLINNTTDAIWSVDSKYQVIAANSAFARPVEMVIGRPLREGDSVLVPGFGKEINNKWEALYKRALEGEAFDVEDSIVNPATNKISYTVVSFSPFKNKAGKTYGVACFAKNVSDLKRSERALFELNQILEKRAFELAASNAELERFAYVASHDLQEPLRMVSSFLQLLEKKYKPQLDDTAGKYIHFAVDGAERMKKLILDLLQYSRVGTGTLEVTAVNMNEVIEEVMLLFKEDIKLKGASIDVATLPVIQAGKTAMVQLMQNLVGNALKYCHENIPINLRISVEEKEQHWQFAVEDNGIGIDLRFKDKIFIVFQRLHNKDEYSGTGIGLAICKKIVERYQGEIWVESQLGLGSKFCFTIAKEPLKLEWKQ